MSSKVVAFRLDTKTQQLLEQRAAACGTSGNNYARQVLTDHLRRAEFEALSAKLTQLTQSVHGVEEAIGVEITKLRKVLLHFMQNTEVVDGA